jgi:CBS domain-containing protein
MARQAQDSRKLDDIGSYLPRGERGSMSVRQVMVEKARHGVISIAPQSSVFEALSLMAEQNIGAVVVVREGEVIGVLSERDYARKVILIGKSSRETKVEEIMGTPVVTVTPETTVAECMAMMTGRFLRHLPVLEDGELVGLVSIGDVVKALLADQEDRLGRIEAYISGAYPT